MHKKIFVLLLILLLWAGNSSAQTSHNITLKFGFNFISFSVSPAATPAELKALNSAIEDIYLFSAAAGSFLSVNDGTLTSLGAGKGYIIKNSSSDSISISVPGTALSTLGDISLKTGFNLVGFSKAPGAATTFTQLMNTYSFVAGIYKWSAAAGSFIQVVRDGAGTPVKIDGVDPSFTAGDSYFMNLSEDTLINYDGANILMGKTIEEPAGATLTLDLGGGVTLEMVKINAAGKSFQMGSPDTEQYSYSVEKPVHTVSLTKDYYIGKYELTQGQWKAIMAGANPSYFKSGDNYPVEQVSWDDISAASSGFLAKINQLAPGGYSGFRLPTEAELEYATRGGTQTSFYWGDVLSDSLTGNYAWYEGNSGSATHPVGGKQPNAFGLYDMSGNVWEWCSDWFESYSSSAVTDPTGPATGSYRIRRGGGWDFDAVRCRSADRDYANPSYTYSYIGFRLALSSGQ